MSRSLCHALLILLWCAALPLPVHAETKVLTAEGSYTMGEGETMTFAEAMALQKAKQMALEQAGIYVESYTKTQNYQLTADEIQTIAGGVLQVEVLEKTRTLIGDGLKHFVKIKATVTTDKVGELAQRIKGKNVAEEYQKLQKEYARLNKEIETWKQLIAKTPSGPDREAALDRIREREKAFAAVQQNEAAFFERLVSGETVVSQALDVKRQLDQLFQEVILRGYSIKLGQPKATVVPDSTDLKLVVPVTLKVSEHVMPLLFQSVRNLNGATKKYSNQATGVRVTDEVDSQEYFLNKVRLSALALDFDFTDGTRQSCSISNDISLTNYKVRFPIYPARAFSFGSAGYAFSADKENFLLVNETPASFFASVQLPPNRVQALQRVSSRIFTREEDRKLVRFPCGIEDK